MAAPAAGGLLVEIRSQCYHNPVLSAKPARCISRHGAGFRDAAGFSRGAETSISGRSTVLIVPRKVTLPACRVWNCTCYPILVLLIATWVEQQLPSIQE